jgi:hypothetical protein
MSSQNVMSLMAVAEFVLWLALGILVWARRLHLRFPALGYYLALRVASMPVLLFFFYGQERHWFNNYAFDMYFYSYWAVYLASAFLLYFVCMEVLRSALSAFPGLQKLGALVFRWVALVSTVVSLSAIFFESSATLIIPAIADRLMDAVSILELCLLAFLCLSMNALRFSFQEMGFGISLGFGLMAANDLIVGALLARNTSLTGTLQFVYQGAILVVIGIWIVYAALPEPARQPVMVSANSAILRWNEIASALGHTGTQVAVRPAEGFVLTDVERAVEEALNRNIRKRESET